MKRGALALSALLAVLPAAATAQQIHKCVDAKGVVR